MPVVKPSPSAWRLLWPALLPPVLLFAFFWTAPAWMNRRVRQAALVSLESRPGLPVDILAQKREFLAQLDFRRVCTDASPELASLRAQVEATGLCRRFNRLDWGFRASVALLAGMLGVVGLLAVLNRAARQSNAALIRCYRLGWTLCMAAAFANLIVFTPLLTYGTFEFSVLLTDRYLPKLLIVIVLGGILALTRSAQILLKRVPLEFREPLARAVAADEAPELWSAIREAAGRLGTAPPDCLVIGMQPNCYVTELAVRHGGGRAEGRTLFLSYPLLKQLSPQDVTAIIGHELGHFIGDDTRLTREFYPLRFKAATTINALAASGWIARPSLHLLALFMWSFGKTERSASRTRELLADQKAAQLTSPEAAARALVRVQVMIDAFNRRIREAVAAREKPPVDEPLTVYVSRKLAPDTAFWSRLFEDRMPHPLDTHPTLRVRLEALGRKVSPAEAQAITTEVPETAWDRWLKGHEALFDSVRSELGVLLEKAGAHSEVAAADPGTEEGRKVLAAHFPEVSWRPAGRTLALLLAAVGGFATVLAAGAAFAPAPPARFIAGGLALALLVGGVAIWRAQRRAEIRLNAEGLAYTGWNRPLRFSEVQSVSATATTGGIILHFLLNEKQRPFSRLSVLPFPRRRVSLSLTGYPGKPRENALTVLRYFHRKTG